MSDQKKILHDDSNGLDYVLVEDYYLPMIDLPKETRPIGYWGMLRKEYLKIHKSRMYLASGNVIKKWTQRYRGWDQVLNQLLVLYGERLNQYL